MKLSYPIKALGWSLYGAGIMATGWFGASLIVDGFRSLRHPESSPAACFDAGSIRGGAEQRAWSAHLNGMPILDSDQEIIQRPIPKGCK